MHAYISCLDHIALATKTTNASPFWKVHMSLHGVEDGDDAERQLDGQEDGDDGDEHERGAVGVAQLAGLARLALGGLLLAVQQLLALLLSLQGGDVLVKSDPCSREKYWSLNEESIQGEKIEHCYKRSIKGG